MKMQKRYRLNKDAKVGEKCVCPSCGATFIKKYYQQVFCKTKGKTVCKDKYWNTVERCNTTRISPAIMEKEIINWKRYGMPAPSVVGGSGQISGITSEGYRIMDGVAYNEFDEPVYNVDPYNDTHPFDVGDAGDKERF